MLIARLHLLVTIVLVAIGIGEVVSVQLLGSLYAPINVLPHPPPTGQHRGNSGDLT